MQKLVVYLLLGLFVLALLPPALIARARTRTSEQRRIHFIQDMDNQARFRAQHAAALFADGRAMRPRVEGTVARGELDVDDHYHVGIDPSEPPAADSGVTWATRPPARLPLTFERLERGRDRFGIYCAPCHGEAGYGDGIVNERAMELMNNPLIGNGTVWVQPKSVHDPDVRDQPIGQVYNTITNGVRNMAGYAAQITIDDRWAIAAYVKTLQRSQHARPGDLTPDEDPQTLPLVDLVPEEAEE